MNCFIFRNTTVENIFGKESIFYSGYNEIQNFNAEADVYIWLYFVPITHSTSNLALEIESYFSQIQHIIDLLPSNRPFLIFTLQDFFSLKFNHDDFSTKSTISNFNNKIIEISKQHSNVKVIDIELFTREYNFKELISWKHYFTSNTVLNPFIAKIFKIWVFKQIDKVFFKRKKCLILDLDNTIWGGVLAEDGIYGIKIGGDYPGNAFLNFQENLIELTKIGVVLAICSKNNEQDVFEVWDKNPFILLKKEHFASYLINWNNKAENIQKLALKLNIGLDSMVFVDDNPSERELVKQFLPTVEVPDFPSQPYQFPQFFASILNEYFSVYELTNEDKTKTEKYIENNNRINEIQNFINYSDYLKSLNIEIQIESVSNFTISRVVQLTQKTNQFNLTTNRYNESDIKEHIDQDNYVYCLNVKDRFGDSGICGAVILKKMPNFTIYIDTFLLSCRVLGKEIEFAFLKQILTILSDKGVKTVKSTFIATTKNNQVSDFYEKVGFEILEENGNFKNYILNLQNAKITQSDNIKIIVKD